jgi:hypothetical protein
MIGRQCSALFASLLALSLMACTGSPLSVGKDKDGPSGGGGQTPAIPSPSPFTELVAPGQSDEAVEDPVPGLNWEMREIASPRDQQIKRILGALRPDGGHKFFLEQGDTFYHRTVLVNDSEPPAWSDQQKLPTHRGLHPTRLFSDGDSLFFVNDSNELNFSGEERVYMARESGGTWQQAAIPAGIVAVAGGPGLAVAATATQLFLWNGSSWNASPLVDLTESPKGERFLGLSVDGEELTVLLSATDGNPYYLRKLTPQANGLVDTSMGFKMGTDRPVKIIRSFQIGATNYHYYWGISSSNYIYYGSGGSSMERFVPNAEALKEPFTRAFKGLSKLVGRFYAYRSDTIRGPEIYHLRHVDVSHAWQTLSVQKRSDGSRLSVTLSGEHSLATDGHRLYAAGPEGLFKYPLINGEPAAYAQGSTGWEQESVELNRASVQRIHRAGTKLYAQTAFGTYVQEGTTWVRFELGGKPAMIFTSHYGEAATVSDAGTVHVYLLQNGVWTKLNKPFPTGALPQAARVFFAKDRLFMAATLNGAEAVIVRRLDFTSDWAQAAPSLGSSPLYYMSDGRTLIAIWTDRVRLASLSDKLWKDYPNTQILADGSAKPLIGASFDIPFAVYGYSFAWIKMGSEYRLCRATATGWKPIVSDQLPGTTVSRQLSTDGHYLYAWAVAPGGNAQTIVRVPIKEGSTWESLPVNYVDGSGTRPLGQANLAVNGPVVIDRNQAKVYLPTSRGILGY